MQIRHHVALDTFKLKLELNYPNSALAWAWHKDPLLQEACSGSIDSIPQLGIFELFLRLLLRNTYSIFYPLWQSNQSLREWYFGKEVEVGNAADTDRRIMPASELIENFKIILTLKHPLLIADVWRNNTYLQTAINNLSVEQRENIHHCIPKKLLKSTPNTSHFLSHASPKKRKLNETEPAQMPKFELTPANFFHPVITENNISYEDYKDLEVEVDEDVDRYLNF